jgi:sigma-B regulation protein RsbU (phosphoserine phosphatase)
VNRFSARHLPALLRRISLLDRVALGIVILYAAIRIFEFEHSIPSPTFLGFLAVAAAIYLVARILPWVRNQLLWRLRNRLIVAYVFIAVVPIVLLSTMLGVAMYLLYMQLGAHLLYDDLQARIHTIRADAQSIADEIREQASHGASPVDERVLSRPEIVSLIAAARSEWPGLEVSLNRGRPLLESGDGRHFAGFSEFRGKLSIAAAEREVMPAGSFTVLVRAPVDSSLLDSLPSDLGPIQLTLLDPPGRGQDQGGTISINGSLYVFGERVASSQRKLGPAANWLDVPVNVASTFVASHVERGSEPSPATVLVMTSLRPFAINKSLFTTVGAVGPLLLNILRGVGVIFLILELAAVATGIVLTRTITRAVADLYDATLHIRRGDFSRRVQVHKRDQLGALGESFNQMTGSVTELIEEQRQRQRLENEVSIAREVQQELFPQSLPVLPGLDLAAICRPARVVSGDYYDFLTLGPARIGIALADISGKGIFAALLMASLQAALRSTAVLDSSCGTAELISRLNRHLFKNTSDDRYATCFYAVYDSKTHTLTYTNAGHPAPFLIRGGRLEQLAEGGTVVGLFEDPVYAQNSVEVAPGTLLVVFSDGLTEPENVYGEQFGVARLKDEVLRQCDMPAPDLAEKLISVAEQWSGTSEQADDMTVVVARMG